MVEKLQSNTVFDDPAPYSQGMIHAETIWLAGQVPDNTNGEIVGDDIETQTKQAVDNVEFLLEKAGSSLESVVSVTAYLTDIDDFEAFNDVYGELFPDPKPARTTVAVAGLAVDARLELQVTAVVEE